MNAFQYTLCLLLIFLNSLALANITIEGDIIHVDTDNYTVQFDYGAITYLHNKLTGETYTLDSNRKPVHRHRRVSAINGLNTTFRAYNAITIEAHLITPQHAEVLFRNGENQIKIVIAAEPTTNDLLISGDCISEHPSVYGIQQWAIDNLDLQNLKLIMPSGYRQVVDASSNIEVGDFLYPTTHWQTQLAIVESKHGGFYVRGTDPTFQFKRLDYTRAKDRFAISFQTHNQAPWQNLTTAESITWRFNTYAGDWCVPAQFYRDWMEQTFDSWKLSDMPNWVNEIGLVVIHPNLNKEIFEPLAEVVNPARTLIYLTNWREEGHDINHPDYSNPHERFESVLEEVKRLGFRAMLHVNVHNCSSSHSIYQEVKQYQYRNPWSGELSGWRWDEIDHPQRNAHISLASSKFRNFLVQQFKQVWGRYNIDAFFLDVSHYVLNDANGLIEGLTSAEGNVLLHKQLAEAMPDAVFGGESVHEVTFFRESFVAYHFNERWEQLPHPLSAFLFAPYTRSHGGIGIPGTDDPLYQLYLENAAEPQSYIPTIWVDSKGDLKKEAFHDMFAVARQWQDLGSRPDLGCGWKPHILLQYAARADVNEDGTIDVLDLIAVANNFGKSFPDINGDGTVNILDLVIVTRQFSK